MVYYRRSKKEKINAMQVAFLEELLEKLEN